ncbi:MAG: hypothetical protein ABSG65_32745 [Bryobacteraceae bacterium]|jgi:hypothetical protein
MNVASTHLSCQTKAFWNGVVTEVYYPTATDGKSFFHDEKRDLKSKVELVPDHGLVRVGDNLIDNCVTPGWISWNAITGAGLSRRKGRYFQAPIRFTFFWTAGNSWEGHDYPVSVA